MSAVSTELGLVSLHCDSVFLLGWLRKRAPTTVAEIASPFGYLETFGQEWEDWSQLGESDYSAEFLLTGGPLHLCLLPSA